MDRYSTRMASPQGLSTSSKDYRTQQKIQDSRLIVTKLKPVPLHFVWAWSVQASMFDELVHRTLVYFCATVGRRASASSSSLLCGADSAGRVIFSSISRS